MAEQNYFQKEIETMSREDMKALQSEKLVKQVKHVYENVPYYRDLMDKKGQCFETKGQLRKGNLWFLDKSWGKGERGKEKGERTMRIIMSNTFSFFISSFTFN